MNVEDAAGWDEPALYGALGYLAGKSIGDRIPLIRGLRPKRDQLKALGAAMAASGAVALFHVEGITPEARIFQYDLSGLEAITVEPGEILSLMQKIPADAVALGSPHCSSGELRKIAGLLEGRNVTIPLYVFAARKVIEATPEAVAAIEKSGGRVYADTCMVVSPALEKYGVIMVNYQNYNRVGLAMKVVPMSEFLDEMVNGRKIEEACCCSTKRSHAHKLVRLLRHYRVRMESLERVNLNDILVKLGMISYKFQASELSTLWINLYQAIKTAPPDQQESLKRTVSSIILIYSQPNSSYVILVEWLSEFEAVGSAYIFVLHMRTVVRICVCNALNIKSK